MATAFTGYQSSSPELKGKIYILLYYASIVTIVKCLSAPFYHSYVSQMTFLQFLCDVRNLFGTKKDWMGPLWDWIFNLVNVSLKTFIILHYCSKFEIFMMTYSAIVEIFIH